MAEKIGYALGVPLWGYIGYLLWQEWDGDPVPVVIGVLGLSALLSARLALARWIGRR